MTAEGEKEMRAAFAKTVLIVHEGSLGYCQVKENLLVLW